MTANDDGRPLAPPPDRASPDSDPDGGDGQLLQLVSNPGVQRSAPTNPGSTGPGRPGSKPAYTPLTEEQISNIVFQETEGLSGADVQLARLQLAQSIMNAEGR